MRSSFASAERTTVVVLWLVTMEGWVEVEGALKNLRGETPCKVVVGLRSPIPVAMVIDYLRHYLDAGSQEECANHPMLGDPNNCACAALTYRYLRPRGEMLVDRRTTFLIEPPAKLGTKLFSDDLIEVWDPNPTR